VALKDYLPRTDANRAMWLTQFASKFPNHVATLEVSADDADFVQKAQEAWQFGMLLQISAQNFAEAVTNWKDALRDTGAKSAPNFTSMISPTIPTDPVFPRLRKIIRRIKTHKNYKKGIGADLGVIGSEPDLNTDNWQPKLKATVTINGVRIAWRRGRAQDINIYVSRDDGKTWQLLSTDAKPPFLDPMPLPAQPQRWKYKAVYRVKDKEVGKESDVVTVVVGME